MLFHQILQSKTANKWSFDVAITIIRLYYYHIPTAQYVLIFQTNIHTPEYYESYLHCTLPRLNYNLISNKKEFGRLHASAGRPADTRLYLHKWCMSSASFFFGVFGSSHCQNHLNTISISAIIIWLQLVRYLFQIYICVVGLCARSFTCSSSDAMGDENRKLERQGKTFKLQNLGQ